MMIDGWADDGCWDIVCDCITDEVCPGLVPSAAVNGAPPLANQISVLLT